MECKHITVETPMFFEHTLFEDQKNFVRDVLEEKKAMIEVRFNTKTTLSINIRLNQFCAGINFNSTDLKYHSPKPEWNFLSGEQVERHHLKLLKTQGFEAIQQHCEAVIKEFFPIFENELDTLTLEYYLTDALQKAIEKDEAIAK